MSASFFLFRPAVVQSVEGKAPTGRYARTVTLERTGDNFRVTWDIDQTGLAIFGAKGNDWEGVWTFTGGKEVGGEVWTRR